MASPAAVLSVLVQAEGIARTTRQVQGLHGDLGKADKTVSGFGKRLEDTGKRGSKALAGLKFAAGLAGVAFGAAGLAAGVKTAVGEYQEAVKVGAQTNAVIKSTGGAANVTAKQVAALSTAISKKAGIDDEAIQSGANLLLTFKGVRNEVGKGNDIFNQATQTITDMSVSLKQGLKPSAIQLGKALNDPIKGITSLSRVGVQFTDQQKTQIAAMVKAGDTLGAQKVILKELRDEFGGSAAAQATALDHLKVTVSNLAEAAGSVLVPAFNKAATFLNVLINQMITGESTGGAIISVFRNLGGAVMVAFGAIRSIISGFKDGNAAAVLLVSAVGTLTAAYVAYRTVMVASTVVTAGMTAATTALTFATGALAAPILVAVAVLAVLAAAVIYAYKHSETFRKIVDAMWATIKVVAAWLITAGVAAFNAVANAVKVAWGVVKAVTMAEWGAVRAFLSPLWTGLKTAAGLVFGAIRAVVGAEFGAIKTIATTVWSAIRLAILNPIRDVRDALGGKDGIWAKIRDTAESAWDKLKTGASNFANGIKDAVVNAFRGAANAVIDFVNEIIDVVNKIPGVPNIKKVGHIGGGGDSKGPNIPVDKKARGGMLALAKGSMVAGSGTGDKVPLHIGGRLAAMVEPGEFVSVANRNATAALMGVNSAIPRYAGGGVLDSVLNSVPGGGLLEGAVHGAKWFTDKLPGTGRLPSWIAGLGSYALGKVKGWIKDKVGSIFSSGPSGGGGPVPAGSVKDWLTKALKITDHFSGANLSALFGRTMQESGGNPHAINLWDINAKQGHPSKGLLQTIDSTFAAYMLPGHGNIWNPVDNAIAAIRYMFATYGHIVGPSSTGYAKGGVIDGGGLPFLGSYHGGGVAPREGLAHVMAGERMTPPGSGPLVHVEHMHVGSRVDENSWLARLGFKIATA